MTVSTRREYVKMIEKQIEAENKSLDEALRLSEEYESMIEDGTESEDLEEALAYGEIYKQQNRKHCAMLPWLGLKKAILNYKNSPEK